MDYEIAALVVVLVTKMTTLLAMFFSVYQHTKEAGHTFVPLESVTGDLENNMKAQQVNVDFWAMAKSMLTYGALTALCWVMLRLFGAVFMLPRRMRQQQQTIQESLQELQRRFPDLNITEEDLMNAEKELDDLLKETDEKDKVKQLDTDEKENREEKTQTKEIEDKKTI